ncbi:MAG: hypothetical protein Q8R57_11360 [Bacteroidota bacterium]|nr:hypothetical protein [Bacteroidota bacterium]
MIKRLFSLILLVAFFAACNNEPKLNQQEENAVQTQLEADQKSMDSLEAAILSQMEEVNLDSLESE